MTPDVLLYTRAECCLCDEAEKILQKHGLNPRKLDIDTDPAMAERFDTCVPVVVIDGKERFRGKVNEILLKRLLDSLRS